MPAMETAHVRPRKLRKMKHQEEVLRLRRSGLSYRAIGVEVGLDHTTAKRLCDAAYRELVQGLRKDAAAALGAELERLDGLIRAASAIMASTKSSPSEKLRAAESIRRTAETKVRWLGLSAPDRVQVDGLSRDDLAASEVAGLDDEALDKELAALGYTKAEVGADPATAHALEATT